MRSDYLGFKQSTKFIGDEGALPQLDPHIRYLRDFRIQTEDGRTIYFKVDGRTNRSNKEGAASIATNGPSELSVHLLVERSDGNKKFEPYYASNSSQDASLNNLISILSGAAEFDEGLLRGAPNEAFLNALITLADTKVPGFPKSKGARQGSGGPHERNIGGHGKTWASDSKGRAPENDIGPPKMQGKDRESVKPWGEMALDEKRGEAWKAFVQEFSWENVAKIVAAGVALVALIASLPEGSALASIATAGMAQLAIAYGAYSILAPYFEGASPEVRDWARGGLMVLGGICFVAAVVASSEVTTSAAFAVTLISGVGLIVSSVISSVADFEEAIAAPNREEMKQLVRSSAREAETAMADGILTVLPAAKLKKLVAKKRKVSLSEGKKQQLEIDAPAKKFKLGDTGHFGDATYKKQKIVVEDVHSGKIELNTNAKKGNYGEMDVDVVLQERGWTTHHERLTDINASTRRGIDHVFSKEGPPKVVLVVDAKFGTSKLSKLVDGTQQMSAKWIEDRLIAATGIKTAEDILLNGYSSVLAKVKPDGSISFQVLNGLGKTIGSFTP